jgi:class 3 adenylate cyclase
MESSGAPGEIHVSEELKEVLADRFEFQTRGSIAVKGKGMMETFFLVRQPC